MDTRRDVDVLDESLRESKAAWITLGVVELIVGAIALTVPGLTALAATYVLAAMLGIGGIARLVHALTVRRWKGSTGDALLGLFYLAACVLIFARPALGAVSLGLVASAWCVIAGVVEIGLALRRPHLPAWGWILLSGIAGVVLGLMIFSLGPAAAVWVVGALVGANILFTGLSALMVGVRLPTLHSPPTSPA